MYLSRINSTSGVHLHNISSHIYAMFFGSRINSTDRVHLRNFWPKLTGRYRFPSPDCYMLCHSFHDVHSNRIYSTSRVHLFSST